MNGAHAALIEAPSETAYGQNGTMFPRIYFRLQINPMRRSGSRNKGPNPPISSEIAKHTDSTTLWRIVDVTWSQILSALMCNTPEINF